MRKRIIAIFCAISIVLLVCTGCKAVATMPYSSEEYEALGWTADEYVAHFKELGFFDFDIKTFDTFDKTEAKVNRIAIEDTSADSWFTEYKDFEKGEDVLTIDKVMISVTTWIPTLTAENCPEFAEVIYMDNDSPDKAAAMAAFMRDHNGEYLEFDGKITSWYDEYFWVGIDCTIAVEESNHTFSWSNLATIDLKTTGEYSHENYKCGLITEGMKVHMRTKIENTKDGWRLIIDSMEIIE